MFAILLLALAQLPEQAQKEIDAAVSQAETARKEYYDTLDAVKVDLVKRLKSQMEATTKKGDLDGALAIKAQLERIEKEDFVAVMEDVLGNSRLMASTEKALLGEWRFRLTNGYVSVVSFKKDGTFTSTNRGGAPGGKWRIEPGKQRVYLQWLPGEAWDTLDLPLNPQLTTGTSWLGPKVTVQANKIK